MESVEEAKANSKKLINEFSVELVHLWIIQNSTFITCRSTVLTQPSTANFHSKVRQEVI